MIVVGILLHICGIREKAFNWNIFTKSWFTHPISKIMHKKILSVVYSPHSAFAFTAINNIKDRHARVCGHPVEMFKLSIFILPLSPV